VGHTHTLTVHEASSLSSEFISRQITLSAHWRASRAVSRIVIRRMSVVFGVPS
jgi:hypothetical protein